MKKTIAKITAAAAAAALLSTGAAFAQESEIPQIQVPAEKATDTAPVVNGASVTGVTAAQVNGTAMIPLRQVAEGLGYTVTWNEANEAIEVIKGAQYITMAIGQDAYSFSRMAYQPLGAAPTLVNDSVTYVPLRFITDILDGYYRQNQDGSYDIINPSVVSIEEVTDGEQRSILVYDSALGQVLVHIDENTQMVSYDSDAPVDMDALKAAKEIGALLRVEYSPAMTMSIPPQTTAVRIEVMGPLEAAPEIDPQEAPAFRGVITEINENTVTIGEPQDPDALRLVVTEDTQITRQPDRRVYGLDDLKPGMEISGTHEEAMTRSLPPQTVAITINIETNN